MVFSIGLPSSHFDNDTYLNYATNRLKDEQAQYDDFIVGEYDDNYYNLAVKTQYSFTWVATFCRRRRPIALFVDDDVPFSHINLAKSLFFAPAHVRTHLLSGILIKRGRVFRDSQSKYKKWSVRKTVIPWPEHPLYPLGVYILVSFGNVEKLTLGMLFTRPYHIDDTWLGLVAARLDMQFQDVHNLISKMRLLRLRRIGYVPFDYQLK